MFQTPTANSTRGICAMLALVVASSWWTPALASAQEADWKYVADETFRPVLRTVPLSTTKPEDLRIEVTFRGNVQKYAQIRYGSEDSRRIAVILDEVGANDWDLYVDSNRNRVVEAKDKLADGGRERIGRLEYGYLRSSELVLVPKTVLWRMGVSRNSLGLGTVGYLAGQVEVAGKKIAARRVDSNANGQFGDSQDRLWLDLNGDGAWDPLAEQFPFAPSLTLGNQRYTVRADMLGKRLSLEPLSGEGAIRLRLAELPKDTAVLKLEVSLACDDGSSFCITAVDSPVTLPIGRYSLASVSILAQQPGSALPSHFVFSRSPLSGERWHELKKDQELILDPLGKIRFQVEVEDLRSDSMWRIQPQLFTADGLLINSCHDTDSEQHARDGGRHGFLKVLDDKKQVLHTGQTGFA